VFSQLDRRNRPIQLSSPKRSRKNALIKKTVNQNNTKEHNQALTGFAGTPNNNTVRSPSFPNPTHEMPDSSGQKTQSRSDNPTFCHGKQRNDLHRNSNRHPNQNVWH
jgi:hypothetical protein